MVSIPLSNVHSSTSLTHRYTDGPHLQTAKALLQRGVKTLPLDQIVSYQVIEGNRKRERNTAEINSQKLPLQPPTPVGAKYMVNLIQLDPTREHMRDTVFWHMYRFALLFENLDAALEYRRGLVSSAPPTFLFLSLCISLLVSCVHCFLSFNLFLSLSPLTPTNPLLLPSNLSYPP